MSRINILIIDSNHNFARVAYQYLTRLDFTGTVELVHNIKDALHKWQQHEFHLLFLDLTFTLRNEADILSFIKEELPHTKIIGLHLFDDDRSLYSFSCSVHCDAFISKESFGEEVLLLLKSLSSP